MDTTSTEINGILSLSIFLSTSNIIKHDISINDKTPSLDGNITIYYDNHDGKKENINGIIPVQIKSANLPERKKRESYPIYKSDLNNYKRSGGTILIRPIYYNNDVNDYDIYIKLLLPVYIEELLIGHKEKKDPKTGEITKSISIELEKINNLDQFEVLCKHFLQEREVQFNTNHFVDIDKAISYIDDGASLIASTIVKEGKVTESLLDSNCCLYLNMQDDFLAPVLGKLKAVGKIVNLEVKVKDKVFFNSFQVIQDNDNIFIYFNTNIYITIMKDSKLKLNIKYLKDSLFINYYNAIKFLNAVNQDKCIAIGDKEITFTSIGKYNESYNITLEMYENINEIFNYFKVDLKNVTIETVLDSIDFLEFLINVFLYNSKAIKKDEDRQVFFRNFPLINKNILLLFKKVDDTDYEVYDFNSLNEFDNKLFITISSKNKIQASRFLILENEYTVETIEGFYKEVLDDLIKFFNIEAFTNYHNFMLNCLKVFDNTRKFGFLKLAEELNEYFIKNANSADMIIMHTINKFQIIKRKRNLKSKEIHNLIEIKNETTDIEVICCLCILLDYHEEFKVNYKKLSNEKQAQFKLWPIINLIKPILNEL